MVTCEQCGEVNEESPAYCLNPSCGARLFDLQPATPLEPEPVRAAEPAGTQSPVPETVPAAVSEQPEVPQPLEQPEDATRPGPDAGVLPPARSGFTLLPPRRSRRPTTSPAALPRDSGPGPEPAAAQLTALRAPGRFLLPAAVAVALLVAVGTVWLGSRPSGAEPSQTLPEVPAAVLPVREQSPAVVSASPTTLPQTSPEASPPGGQTTGSGPGPGQTVKPKSPAPKTSTAPAPPPPPPPPPAASLNMGARVDCLGGPDWGVQLDGSVANAGGRSIVGASLYYQQNGGQGRSGTLSLSSGVDQWGPGYWSGLTLRSWAPDNSGDAFWDGSSVFWRVTVNLSGGVTVTDSATTSNQC